MDSNGEEKNRITNLQGIQIQTKGIPQREKAKESKLLRSRRDVPQTKGCTLTKGPMSPRENRRKSHSEVHCETETQQHESWQITSTEH